MSGPISAAEAPSLTARGAAEAAPGLWPVGEDFAEGVPQPAPSPMGEQPLDAEADLSSVAKDSVGVEPAGPILAERLDSQPAPRASLSPQPFGPASSPAESAEPSEPVTEPIALEETESGYETGPRQPHSWVLSDDLDAGQV